MDLPPLRGGNILTIVPGLYEGDPAEVRSVLKSLGGIGLSHIVRIYQEGIHPKFARVLKSLGGIGLIRSQAADRYQKGIQRSSHES